MDKNQLIDIIEFAFAHVILDDGIGLWEAQAIDDYETKEIQLQKRRNDRKEDWFRFTSDELQLCHSSLSFFDANGMRFHLPAFIVASLNDEVDDPLFHLTNLSEYNKSQFTTLTTEQNKAVVSYLNWCLQNTDHEHDHKMIIRALNKYWLQKI